MINVKSEQERITAAKEFLRTSIEELDREINGCDYEEGPDENLVYSPGVYSYEKQMFQSEKRKLEIILDLLTREVPFTLLDW